MSTGLKVYEPSEFAALSPNSDIALAMRENMEGETFSEMDLIRVKIPTGGSTVWNIEGVSGIEATEAIEGVCVFKAYKGLLWPQLESNGEDKPILVSYDLRTAKLNVPIDDVPEEMMEQLIACELPGHANVYDWTKLPYTQFGTGKNGVGKFAKEHLVLFILRKNEGLPLYIQVGSGSLAVMKKFFIRMQNVPYYRAVVSLSLKAGKSTGGQTYAQMAPRLIGTLSPEVGAVVKSQYTDRLKASHEAGRIDDSVE